MTQDSSLLIPYTSVYGVSTSALGTHIKHSLHLFRAMESLILTLNQTTHFSSVNLHSKWAGMSASETSVRISSVRTKSISNYSSEGSMQFIIS